MGTSPRTAGGGDTRSARGRVTVRGMRVLVGITLSVLVCAGVVHSGTQNDGFNGSQPSTYRYPWWCAHHKRRQFAFEWHIFVAILTSICCETTPEVYSIGPLVRKVATFGMSRHHVVSSLMRILTMTSPYNILPGQ